MNGIQPIWLSEKAILRDGNRASCPERSHSTIDCWALVNVSVTSTSNGAYGLASTSLEPEPMCMQSAVPVSSQAAKKGSQNRLGSWIEGRPRWLGISVNVTARQPRAALRRISAAASGRPRAGRSRAG